MKLPLYSLLLVAGQLVTSQVFEDLETPSNYPGISDSCSKALNTTLLNCPSWLWSRSVDNPRLNSDQLGQLCTPDCEASLTKVRKTIADGCTAKSDIISIDDIDWPATFFIDRFTYTYELSCRKDSHSNDFCDEIFVSWLDQRTLTDAQKCSDCMLGVVQIQLNSPFGYDEEFASRFAYTTSRCKASGYPFTSPAAYALSSSAATSSTYITTPECSDPYQVQPNDTCDSIALAQNVSTDGLQVAGGLSQTCSNLHAVGPFCLPPSCALYYVQVDDTCESILSANPGLTASQLLAWNPGINSMCGNIRYFEYTYICIGPPGGSLNPVVTPAPSPTSRAPTTSATVTPVPRPTNGSPQLKLPCGEWYVVKQGDACATVAEAHNIALNDFYFLNPGINTTCGNLELGIAYCVKAVGDISTYPSYPVTSQPYTIPPMHYTTTTSTFPSPAPPRLITHVPLPTAPGTVANCTDYVEHFHIPSLAERAQLDYVFPVDERINSCFFAMTAYEVSLEDFLAWNPSLTNITPCALQPGNSYCLFSKSPGTEASSTTYPFSPPSETTESGPATSSSL